MPRGARQVAGGHGIMKARWSGGNERAERRANAGSLRMSAKRWKSFWRICASYPFADGALGLERGRTTRMNRLMAQAAQGMTAGQSTASHARHSTAFHWEMIQASRSISLRLQVHDITGCRSQGIRRNARTSQYLRNVIRGNAQIPENLRTLSPCASLAYIISNIQSGRTDPGSLIKFLFPWSAGEFLEAGRALRRCRESRRSFRIKLLARREIAKEIHES